jgi:hypothetical protein
VVRGGVEPPTFRFSGVPSPLDHDLITIVTTQLTGISAGQWAYTAIIATVPPCATKSRFVCGLPVVSPSEAKLVGLLWASWRHGLAPWK